MGLLDQVPASVRNAERRVRRARRTAEARKQDADRLALQRSAPPTGF